MEFKKVSLGNYFIFYNLENKILGRIPTPSNIDTTKSDNSLYFGILGATRGGLPSNVFEEIMGINQDDFSNHQFNMVWNNESVVLHTNLNDQGQLQMKVWQGSVKSMVAKMVANYMEDNNMSSFAGYGIFIDFNKSKISCKKVVDIDANTVKVEPSRLSRAKKTVEKIINEVDAKYPNISLEEKNAYIEALIQVRSSSFQKVYRKRLLKEFGCKCAICNINIEELLIASHIVSYKECANNDERVDYNNGLLLCVNHDALFDKGLISFDQNGNILYAFENLPDLIFEDLNINKNIKLDNKYLTSKRKKYLLRHKKKF